MERRKSANADLVTGKKSDAPAVKRGERPPERRKHPVRSPGSLVTHRSQSTGTGTYYRHSTEPPAGQKPRGDAAPPPGAIRSLRTEQVNHG